MGAERLSGNDGRKLLGQELYRRAIKDGNLIIFDHVSEVIENPKLPIIERVNALKAIRFGLAGIAIDGWQSAITQSILTGPQQFGSSILSYQFVRNQFFPDHDSSIIDKSSNSERPIVKETQGEHALKVLRKGIEDSMKSYLTDEKSRSNGIDISVVLDTLTYYVTRGKALDLDKIPDLYDNGRPFFSGDIYESVKTKAEVIDAISSVAINPLRFTSGQIIESMTHFSGLYHGRSRALTDPETKEGNYTYQQIINLLLNTTSFVTRASQRMDGVFLVPDDTRGESYGIEVIDDGESSKVVWPTKGLPLPPRHVELSDIIPTDERVAITDRQRCPIGYTPDAHTLMPISKIYEGIFEYLNRFGLLDPIAFSQPKILIPSIRF